MIKSKYPELNDRGWLTQRYWGEGLSQQKISGIVGCTPDSVRRAFIRLDIEKRPFEETILRGENHPFYGTHFTVATREKQSKAKEGKCDGDKNPFYGKKHKKETKDAWSKKREGVHNSSETEFKKGMTPWNKGKKDIYSPEVLERMRKAGKALWQDEEYIRNWMKAIGAKPNKLEKMVDRILQKLQPNEWKYNGNFDAGVTIGGLIPDFVNVNGKKIVIEVFGDWHDEKFMRDVFKKEISWRRTEFGKKAIYAQLGYKCTVLWIENLTKNKAEEYILNALTKIDG